MGFYRFFLALLVAVSHTGINVYGFNPGVVAVISFFLLSGYVMTQLIRKYYLQPARISRFYLDRAARLFPQYLFYFTLASLFLYISDMPTIFTHKLNATKWLLNIPILPLGFYQWLCCSRGQIHALAAASFLIFLTAFTGLIDTDAFGYRLLPGTLFMFLVGAAFAEDDTARSARLFRHAITAAAAILLAFACWQTRYYALPYNKEVLLGLLLGLVALSLLRHRSRSAPDEFFGNLSYGVFLNHFIVIWWLRKHYDIEAYGGFDVIMLLLISTLMATASFYFVERPAIHWRHSIRQVTSNKQ